MKKNSNEKNLHSYNANVLSAALKRFGFVFPDNEEDIEEFEKTFGSTDIELPSKLQKWNMEDVEKIKEIKSDDQLGTRVVQLKEKKNDYFKKLVLAAHIANELYAEYTFGRIKFVKLLYLCEEVCDMQLSTCYGKYAAGPLDPKLIYTIDSEFKKRNWFTIIKTNYGYRYNKDENVEEYKKYYLNYYKENLSTIDHVIDLFRKLKSDFCEIVATMFFVWKENLHNNYIISDSLLITHFYNWGEKKKRFEQKELKRAISWMHENKIVPK